MSENPYANMTDAELEARIQELLKKKKPQKNENPYANMTDEEIDARIQDLSQKEQISQQPTIAPEPTLMDRASQFGSGFMHSLGEGALNAQNPEEEMWSPNTYSGQPGEVANSLTPETRGLEVLPVVVVHLDMTVSVLQEVHAPRGICMEGAVCDHALRLDEMRARVKAKVGLRVGLAPTPFSL